MSDFSVNADQIVLAVFVNPQTPLLPPMDALPLAVPSRPYFRPLH
jgi:hypothetical protein